MRYIKNYLISTILLILFTFISFKIVNSYPYTETTPYNILVVCSYSPTSSWEQSVINGVRNKLSPYTNISLNIEYLDSRSRFDIEYRNSFIDLLNLKYFNKTVDAILTIDDEAFNLIKSNIFNPKTFISKTPTVFIGVNETINLTRDESEYITGVVEIEDNLKLLNMLLDIHKDLEEINVILDNTHFSTVVESNINDVVYLTKRPLKINFIRGTYMDEIIDQLKGLDDVNQVCLLIGDFKGTDKADIFDLKTTVNLLKSTTTAPIYTKIEPYLYAGAIGGIVDIGEYHGSMAGEIFIRLAFGETINNIKPIYNALDVTIFNYDALSYYNINPLLLPQNSVFINKRALDFLLPKWLKYIVWTSILFSLVAIIVLISSYIKQRKRAYVNELLLNKALESEKLKTDFITTVSHELRTPLNIILNTSKLLNLKLHEPTVDTQYIVSKLVYINKSSNRLLRLINNIIDITKLEAGFISPKFNNYNIVEIVEEIVLSVVELAKSKGIEIVFDTEYEEIITAVDKEHIERITLNLMSNAIKFTSSNGIINVNIRKQGDNVTIEISDSGIGISEDKLQHIFDRFYQVDTSLTRSNEGSGIGLSIVKGLVEIQKGTINVISKENFGTTFSLSFPIYLINSSDNINNLGYSDLEQLVNLEMSDLDNNN